MLLQSNSLQSKKQLLLLLLLCPQRHGPAGRGNTMVLKDERSPKYAFPEAGTSLLKSPTKRNPAACCLLLPAAACRSCLLLAAACSCLLLAVAGCCWLLLAAAGCLTPAAAGCCCRMLPARHVLLPAAGCCWLVRAAAGCCWLLPAACCLLLPGSIKVAVQHLFFPYALPLQSQCYAGYWLAAVPLTATDAAGTLDKNSIGAAAAAAS